MKMAKSPPPFKIAVGSRGSETQQFTQELTVSVGGRVSLRSIQPTFIIMLIVNSATFLTLCGKDGVRHCGAGNRGGAISNRIRRYSTVFGHYFMRSNG
jgi:hypothetical protein